MDFKWRDFVMTIMLLPLFMVAEARAFDLQISEGKLTVSAEKVPLQDLLRVLSYNDIIVRIDPKINPSVSAAFSNRDLEQGIKSILKPHNHAFIWKPTPPTPENQNRSYQLEEIHIFRPGEKDRMVVIEPAGEPQPDQITEAVETEVVIKNNKIYVPVSLVYQERRIETTLVFDTGAGGMVLHENLAEELGIDQSVPSTARGVGGVKIETRLAQLNNVIVGPHEKKNLRASIVTHQQDPGQEPDALYNGLLGMNFLRGIKYVIDYDNQTIRWLP